MKNVTDRVSTCLVLLICTATPSAVVTATPPNPGGGLIATLTNDARAAAIACGRAGAECAVKPYQLCPSPDARYTAWIATPFSRVASSVFESVQRRQRPRPMDAGTATLWGVGVYVLPPDDVRRADSIRRVFLRRGGDIIEAHTTTLAPVTIAGSDGISREVAKGFFSFPIDAFAPTGDLTVVFVSESGETTCTLDSQRLQALR
jgi:hypothetical protein